MDGFSAGMTLSALAGTYGLHHDIITFAPCREDFHDGLHFEVGLETLKHVLCLVVEPLSLFRLLW